MLLGKLCEQVNNNNRKQGGLLPDECRLSGGQLEGGALEEGQEEAKRRGAGWGGRNIIIKIHKGGNASPS